MSYEDSKSRRIKKAEILGGVGAVILGMGIGSFFSSLLGTSALVLLIVGLAAHALGMFEKHRVENESAARRVWWSELLYWMCWTAMLILFAYIGFSYFAK